MAKKKNIKLTEHISYCIIDSTIYLFQNNINLSEDEIEILYKKLALIIEDNGISYINISASKIEDRKEMYQKLGFSLSYYDVNKLNVLYDGKKNKKDFFDKINNKEDNAEKHDRVINSNSGYVYNLFLLFGSIIFLCYLCVQGAIYLVK